ncbi:MAG TPA: phasin family protein [Azospira sp.]|nr:phasin family protein [Azospira sp.]
MSLTENQFAAAGKAQLETLTALAQQGFANIERLAELNLSTARSALEDGTANTKTLLAAKTPQEFLNLQTQLAQPLFGKAIAYAQSAYQIATQNQQATSQLFEGQAAEFSKTFADSLTKVAGSFAPSGKKAG